MSVFSLAPITDTCYMPQPGPRGWFLPLSSYTPEVIFKGATCRSRPSAVVQTFSQTWAIGLPDLRHSVVFRVPYFR